MQIFESSNKNTISTTTLNYGGPLGLWHINFFLKSIDLKVPNLTAPLNVHASIYKNWALDAFICYFDGHFHFKSECWMKTL